MSPTDLNTIATIVLTVASIAVPVLWTLAALGERVSTRRRRLYSHRTR